MTPNQNTYLATIASQTGLSPNVIQAWMACESGSDSDSNGGSYNFLNIGPGRKYATPTAAANAAIAVINQSNMAAIRDAYGQSEANQIAGISSSPWDAGHYVEHGPNCIAKSLGVVLANNSTAPAPTQAASTGGVTGLMMNGITDSFDAIVGAPTGTPIVSLMEEGLFRFLELLAGTILIEVTAALQSSHAPLRLVRH